MLILFYKHKYSGFLPHKNVSLVNREKKTCDFVINTHGIRFILEHFFRISAIRGVRELIADLKGCGL